MQELALLEEELKELRTVDSFITKARLDLKNLSTQSKDQGEPRRLLINLDVRACED